MMANNDDFFGYLHFVIENRHQFEAIGARGCLAAVESLMPVYEVQNKLDESERGEYWHRTWEDRKPAEALAEDSWQFGRLLLTYVRTNRLGEEGD
jgi:hypothetical protein